MPKKVDFYRLPRPVQDRFVAATKRTAPPAPLLFHRAPRTTAWAYLGGSALLAAVAALLLRLGWGDVASPLARHGAKMIVVDLLLWGAAAYGVVHAMALLRALDVLPYKAGTYLFPGCAVEALGPVLRVWPLGDADAIERLATPVPALALRMRDGQRLVVPARSVDDAERADRTLTQVRADLARALTEDDTHVLAELDPLHDSALSSPLGPVEMMKYVLPAWTRFDWAIAAAIGLALGLGLTETRNAMSDDAMFRTVAMAASIPAYQQYLAQGGRHAGEVRDTLLPRAELHDAEAQGTIDAVEAFARTHADSKIAPEIDAAVKRALLVELDKAKKLGTVAALDDFARKYPDNKLDAELKAARHALYVQALAGWKKKAQADAATSAFVERLLAVAEKSGSPACEIRFRLRPSRTLDDADKAAMKNNHYPGPDALPSRYVTAAAMRTREQRLADDLARGFASEFSADVLAVRPGEPLAPDAPMPSTVPSLVVEYSPEWSHVNTVSLRPPTIFAGINFAFEASFVLPEGAPLSLKTKSWRGAELWKMKDDGMSRTDFQQKVYDSMIDGAFDQLEKRLQDTFL